MAKMGNKMIALCTAAIGAVYIAGYVVTEPAESSLGNSSVPATATPTQNQTTNEQAAQNNQSSHVDNSQTTQATQDTQTNQSNQPNQQNSQSNQPKYRDGTFQGSGTNRFGTVSVAVTVKQGKITNVQITDCSTHYPESYIDPILPQEVLERQSENVDVVSGATRSTEDFVNAVDQALQQALA